MEKYETFTNRTKKKMFIYTETYVLVVYQNRFVFFVFECSSWFDSTKSFLIIRSVNNDGRR